ncbi:MAG: PAS and ANTAR domain-containing protein [Nocardioidaceae bacterium]
MTTPVTQARRPEAPVGHFVYAVAEDRWEWSDGIYILHGFAPRTAPATTAFLLRHKHPDDLARTVEAMRGAVGTGQPFACYHRVVDRQLRIRPVLWVGRGRSGPDGVVDRVTGFFVDLSQIRRDEVQVEVEVALTRIAEHRGVIEQAKGVLMFATGCDAEAAFAILRRHSSTENLKLHDLARRLVDSVGPELHASRESAEELLARLTMARPLSGQRSAAPLSAAPLSAARVGAVA